jgi:hypothetical protein
LDIVIEASGIINGKIKDALMSLLKEFDQPKPRQITEPAHLVPMNEHARAAFTRSISEPAGTISKLGSQAGNNNFGHAAFIESENEVQIVNPARKGGHSPSRPGSSILGSSSTESLQTSSTEDQEPRTTVSRSLEVSSTISDFLHRDDICNLYDTMDEPRISCVTTQEFTPNIVSNQRAESESLFVPLEGDISVLSKQRRTDVQENLNNIPTERGYLQNQTPERSKFSNKHCQVRNANLKPRLPIEMPVGAPDCLAGYTFVFLGRLPSFRQAQAVGLVKQYGGRVTNRTSGLTSFVVVGESPGERELEIAKGKHLKMINEDGLISLIKKLPAQNGERNMRSETTETTETTESTTEDFGNTTVTSSSARKEAGKETP